MVTFVSTNTNVAAVDEDGIIYGIFPGDTYVSVAFLDDKIDRKLVTVEDTPISVSSIEAYLLTDVDFQGKKYYLSLQV